MSVKIRVKNLDKALLKLESLEGIDLKPVLTEVTNRIKRDAKLNAPKDLGDLRASIMSKVERTGEGESISWFGRVYTNLEYAQYVEFGTSKPHFVPAKYIGDWAKRHGIDLPKDGGLMVSGKPQPYMLPAYKTNKIYTDRAIKSALKNNIKSIAK
jgi:HK97 gp10 family phage protein